MFKSNLLAKIHIGKKELCLSDDEYRAFLFGLTKKESSKELTENQKRFIIFEMKKRGAFKKKTLTNQQKRTIAIWSDLVKAGAVKSNKKTALNAYIKKHFSTYSLAFLSDDKVKKLNSMLSSWLKKGGLNGVR